ncbi:SM-like, degradation of cytoplasmic mRNAs and positively regulates transcription initiation [Maudiozyma exigua]|uniref:U6 snRNA-associated Sm-like protein LSm1 n=1 Tax=Maudiozyma exigua TaxID=34358 RepID=A0A9P6VXM3_MAUEX|nr:SM-like, degradation of cytoplasmic mRNAs and positively regulates transcription initiation [Kazachstania exigua]
MSTTTSADSQQSAPQVSNESSPALPNQQQQQQNKKEKKQAKKITEGEADLYLDQYNFTTTAAIVSSVDRKIFVLLRDGKLLFGVLRTFDQYANLILQHCVERIYLTGEHKGKYAEEDRGIFMIRGENVVMLGEVDIDKEDQPLESLEQIPFTEAQSIKKLNDDSKYASEIAKTKIYARHGLTHDFHKADMY